MDTFHLRYCRRTVQRNECRSSIHYCPLLFAVFTVGWTRNGLARDGLARDGCFVTGQGMGPKNGNNHVSFDVYSQAGIMSGPGEVMDFHICEMWCTDV
jgi:hypothetical protein